MHSSVADRFVEFTSPLEGVVPSLYVDVNGAKSPPVPCVTTAIGCLVDPVESALALPWILPDGSRASAEEISRQWHVVKADAARLSKLHWRSAAALTTIRLTDEGVLDLVRQRLLENEKVLRGYFPNWEAFPADAQLACCSMAWAVGAGFPRIFGNFRDAANRQDWSGAQAACAIRTDGNPGIVPRNAQKRLCLANALAEGAQGLPLETLFWPGTTPSAAERDEALRKEAAAALALHTDFQGNVVDADGRVLTVDDPTNSGAA